MHSRKAAWQTGIFGNLQCLERFAGPRQGCGRGGYSLAGKLSIDGDYPQPDIIIPSVGPYERLLLSLQGLTAQNCLIQSE